MIRLMDYILILTFFVISTIGYPSNFSPLQELYKIPADENIITKIEANNLKPKLDPNHISLLVWNLYKGKKDSWIQDFSNLKNNTDISLFQEFYLSDKMKPILESDPILNYTLATSFISSISKIPTGVMTAYSINPILEFPIKSPNREPIILTPKMALVSRFLIEGTDKILTTINIHSLNFVSLKVFKKQIDNIFIKVNQFFGLGPIIFAGDFNNNTQAKSSYINTKIKMLGLKSVPFSPDSRMIVNKQTIDFIFYKGLSLISSKVWGNLKGSDHKALSAIFKTN